MTTLTSKATVSVSRATYAYPRLFFLALAALMAVVVFVGFSPTYYLKGLYGTPALTQLYHVHGLLFTCWMLLIIAQPALVILRRTDLHKRVGWIAPLLIAAMTVAAYFVSVDLGRRGAAPPGISPLAFLAVPLATVLVFPLLSGAALLLRGTPQTHKRLMLIATLELVPAGFGRWPLLSTMGPIAFFGPTDLFIVAMLVYDRLTSGRFHPATVYGGAFLVGSQVARIAGSGTETWLAFARWIIS